MVESLSFDDKPEYFIPREVLYRAHLENFLDLTLRLEKPKNSVADIFKLVSRENEYEAKVDR